MALASPTSAKKQMVFEANVKETLSLLRRCSNLDGLKQTHGLMLKTGLLRDSLFLSKLLTCCISVDSRDLAYANVVFDQISKPNTFMWNVMIRGSEPEQALVLYQNMLYSSVPHNAYTFPFLLKSCSYTPDFEETRQIHAHVIKFGFGLDVYAMNSLIHVYAVSGHCIKGIESASLLFDRIPIQDVVSCNSMINLYSKCGETEKAIEIFRKMSVKNVISWTAMISGCVKAGMNEKALNLFHEMQMSGVEPDNMTVATVITACTNLGSLDQGRWVHAYIDKRLVIDSVLGCVLIDMYAKCGDMDEAIKLFEKIKTKKSVYAWTAIIYGLAIHGRGKTALEWFTRMQEEGIKPNLVTFTAVLTACSYAGLVSEGRSLFESMENEYGLKPTLEHYGCMVDLLGRAGLLEEAKGVIMAMDVKPNAIIWGAMLKACLIHNDIEFGKRIGEILIELDPKQSGRYVHLASVQAKKGEWGRVVETRQKMRDRGVSKLPGCSAVCVNGMVHEFFAGDGSHMDLKEIAEWYI